MLGRLRFQQRIALLVALAATALLTVTALTLVLGRRSEQQLSGVETRYLPLLELDRDLKAQLAGLTRALEDAASAAEESSLAEADALRDQLRQRLIAGRVHIVANGADPEALLRELGAYYEQAREVSRALITGEADEELPARVEAMHAAQARFATHLDTGTTPDRARVAAAFAAARRAQRQVLAIDITIAVGVFVLMLLLSWAIIRRTVQSLHAISQGMERLARGDFSQEIVVTTRDEFGDVAREANRTAGRLREYREQGVQEDWIKTGVGNLAAEIAGELEQAPLGRRALTYLARYVGAPVGAAYAGDEGGTLRLLDLYGAGGDAAAALPASFRPGEGILGQAVHDDEIRVISEISAGYLSIRSALGTMPPRHLLVVPFSHEGRVMGVLELGLLEAPSVQTLELMRRTRGPLGVAFRVAESRQRAQVLLEETQRQAEELRQTNDELEEQTVALEDQRSAVVQKNQELITTQQQLEDKAAELARASRYKSEFLANMSHELRTPLNSVMILSKILGDDQDRNLTEKQVEFARVIHKSGEELLTLINDVLDLAKVEAGKQELVLEPLPLAELVAYARQMFEPMAAQKGLALELELEAGLPTTIRTDRTRLAQILKNLVSNAIKFTAHGRVRVRLYRPMPGQSPSFAGLASSPRDPVVMSVSDTGIGIPRDKQKWIFEAFAQADGGTSRKYGGTGLGLTIARELAVRLGGDLLVESEPGQGSTFHVLLAAEGPPEGAAATAATAPLRREPAPGAASAPGRAAPAAPATGSLPAAVVEDDRDALGPGEPCLLIIEDDRNFAELVLRLARDASFKGLVATDGQSGLELARRHRPSGIILDVGLPDIDGWSVMERLKEEPATREIPVHFMTACNDSERARRMGAVGFLAKPADTAQIASAIRALERSAGTALRKLLVVENDAARREALRVALTGADLAVEAVGTPQQALARLAADTFGCVVLDLLLPDRQSGFDLLARLRHEEHTASIPVVVHTGVALSPEEIRSLEAGDQAIVILSGERSVERVLEESRLFLHQVRTRLPAAARPRPGGEVPHTEAVLRGKTVLIVDDDMRNVYSLSSALKAKHLHVLAAADGQEALDELEAHPDTDVVLMDVMMPRMDGHEATRRIRAQPRFLKLPIIALTAKTMPGERKKCLDAGASDYVPKPVDVDRLLALLRVWLG